MSYTIKDVETIILRFIVAGQPQHDIQRENNRQPIFEWLQ